MTDTAAAVPACTLRRHHVAVSAVEFNPDATLMASADQNGHVAIWSTATFRPVRAWNAHPMYQILRVSFLNDTTLLTFGRGDAVNAVATAPLLIAQMQILSGVSSDTSGESHFLVALPSADESGKFDVFLL
ncbi:hypothetical protein AMAG_02727 [Allomyces macrogynus ATCC 38327]|uniref:Uncharacterized protein n=1 Tax=Allomyces macrogynus (strain ATCC 38327) TaxID=578462 RepID=A0A0L0S3J0_ALLM3|nr:hypothetical protein AMAG_02727 [Allomyces macrogynus ATCC 38327]|eukprot:KNE56961.1 hypothetical protein AMAG_02727 [Allomyces macrogynus ATCC 38327]